MKIKTKPNNMDVEETKAIIVKLSTLPARNKIMIEFNYYKRYPLLCSTSSDDIVDDVRHTYSAGLGVQVVFL